jgi:hypothetical protein
LSPLTKVLKIGLVAWLVLLLPFSVVAFAAAGSTLTNPAGGERVATILITHVVATIVLFALLAIKPQLRWPWAIAAGLAIWFPALILFREISYHA